MTGHSDLDNGGKVDDQRSQRASVPERGQPRSLRGPQGLPASRFCKWGATSVSISSAACHPPKADTVASPSPTSTGVPTSEAMPALRASGRHAPPTSPHLPEPPVDRGGRGAGAWGGKRSRRGSRVTTRRTATTVGGGRPSRPVVTSVRLYDTVQRGAHHSDAPPPPRARGGGEAADGGDGGAGRRRLRWAVRRGGRAGARGRTRHVTSQIPALDWNW